MATLHYLPPVRPSAILLGTAFNHSISLAVMTPLFGDAYRRAEAANTRDEFIRSREAASAVAAWSASLSGSALQAYGVGALLNATGTFSQKGAVYLGTLVFFASSAPSIISQVVTESRPLENVGISILARLLETVGLACALNYWGTRTSPL